MLWFVAFSWMGRKKPTDISFQVSIPLNNQQAGGSYSSKWKNFIDQTRQPGSQSYSPTLKKWECLYCSQSCIWQDSAAPQQQSYSSTAVSLYPAACKGNTPRSAETSWFTAQDSAKGELFWDILDIYCSSSWALSLAHGRVNGNSTSCFMPGHSYDTSQFLNHPFQTAT